MTTSACVSLCPLPVGRLFGFPHLNTQVISDEVPASILVQECRWKKTRPPYTISCRDGKNSNFANSEPCGRMAASASGTFVGEHRHFTSNPPTGERLRPLVYEVNSSVHGGTGSGSWE